MQTPIIAAHAASTPNDVTEIKQKNEVFSATVL